MTCIPEYQSIPSIAHRLCTPVNVIEGVLQNLQNLGLVELKDDRWVYRGGEFHVPKNSPLVVFHHQNWRQRAVLDAQDFESAGVHFTGVFTLSHEDQVKLKELLVDFIGRANSLAVKSAPHELAVFTCDFFRA